MFGIGNNNVILFSQCNEIKRRIYHSVLKTRFCRRLRWMHYEVIMYLSTGSQCRTCVVPICRVEHRMPAVHSIICCELNMFVFLYWMTKSIPLLCLDQR